MGHRLPTTHSVRTLEGPDGVVRLRRPTSRCRDGGEGAGSSPRSRSISAWTPDHSSCQPACSASGRSSTVSPRTPRRAGSDCQRRSTGSTSLPRPLASRSARIFRSAATPWVTTPLTDYASLRVDLRKVNAIKAGETVIGQEVKAKVVKNRQAAPMTAATFEMRFATGIRAETDLVSLGLETGLVSKRGARLFFGEQLLGAGHTAALNLLNQDAELFARLRDAIVERMKG